VTGELIDKEKITTISAKKLMQWLVYVFLILLGLHLVSTAYMYFNGEVLKRFDFNNERNFPTYYATFQLLLSGYLLWWISKKKIIEKNFYRFHWRGLSIIFYILALDEGVRIHDRINSGIAGGWIKTYLIIICVIGVFYLFFVKSLPAKIRNLMVLSGLVYVGGALGMEVVGVMLKNNGMGYHHMAYRAAITIEESIEFIGLILFIGCLLKYIKLKYKSLEDSFFNKKIKISF